MNCEQREQSKTQCIFPTQLQRYHILAFLWTVLLQLFSRSFSPPFSSLIVHFLSISIASQTVASLLAHLVASACSAGDWGSISSLRISPGEGKGYPLWYSCLENSMDRRACPRGRKESDMTEWLTLLLLPKLVNCVSVLDPSLSILLCIVLVCACSISFKYHLF